MISGFPWETGRSGNFGPTSEQAKVSRGSAREFRTMHMAGAPSVAPCQANTKYCLPQAVFPTSCRTGGGTVQSDHVPVRAHPGLRDGTPPTEHL